jgi:hypothetical protein
MRWWEDIIDLMNMNLGKLWEMLKDREAWCAKVQLVSKSQTQLKRLNNNNSFTPMFMLSDLCVSCTKFKNPQHITILPGVRGGEKK